MGRGGYLPTFDVGRLVRGGRAPLSQRAVSIHLPKGGMTAVNRRVLDYSWCEQRERTADDWQTGFPTERETDYLTGAIPVPGDTKAACRGVRLLTRANQKPGVRVNMRKRACDSCHRRKVCFRPVYRGLKFVYLSQTTC